MNNDVILKGNVEVESENFSISSKSIPEILRSSVSLWSNQQAISFYNQSWTYSELQKDVDTLAASLQKLGIKKGDRVALMLPNCPQYIVTYYAILTVGAIVVQINPMSSERELQYILYDSKAETIIYIESVSFTVNAIKEKTSITTTISVSLDSLVNENDAQYKYAELIQQKGLKLEHVTIDSAEDVAIIQYTGGTTGRSKGVMLTHRNLVANIEQHDERYKDRLVHGKERVLITVPLFHVFGMTVCMNLGIYQGSCLIPVPRFSAEVVLDLVQKEKPTRFDGVPTMFIALNNHLKLSESGFKHIKFCHSGGAAMPVELIEEFERKSGTIISEAYGLSETSPGVLGQISFDKRKHGSVGVPLPLTECKIVDLVNEEQEVEIGEVGQLLVKGPQVMKGYWNMPEETAASLRDGWLFTGDMARMDEDGYVYIVDRMKDLIITGGYNVYPREVEEVLYEHPAVLEAVVIGVADPYKGETVKAVVVLKEGSQLSAEELTAFCKKNLSAYKVPKVIEFRSEMPKTTVGKILRRALRAE